MERRTHVSRGTAGQVILSLLINTLWPQTLIAQLADVNVSTVARIARRNALQNRYRVMRRTLHTMKDLHFSKRLWYGLIDAYNDEKRVLPHETIKRVLLSTKKALDTHANARRKLRLARLKGVKVRRKIPRCTNLNEGLSHTEAALLALMLQSINPTPAPRKEPGRRVIS